MATPEVISTNAGPSIVHAGDYSPVTAANPAHADEILTLLASGLGPDDLYGYYLTEDDGRPIGVFPSPYTLRYTVPWRGVEETIDFLPGLAENAADGRLPIAVRGDDGQKFCAWPSPHEPG